MVGSLNKLPLAVISLVLFNDPCTYPKACGMLVATGAGYLYTRAKQAQNIQIKNLEMVAGAEGTRVAGLKTIVATS